MIARVLPRGKRVQGVLRYLYQTGEDSRHVDPRVIGSWRYPIDVEPPVTAAGKRDFRPLTALLEQPLAIRDADRRPRQPVWHCVLRAAPGDRNLTDDEWREIVRELMHRLGLSERGGEGDGVRWVAVAHGDNHVHVVAVMARQDGRRAHVDREYIRAGQTARWAERTYKLHVTGHADGTADKRPTRAEQEKARRTGRRQPPRVTLRRKVQAAAAAAESESKFFAGLAARGVQVRLRHSTVNPGEVTGYAVGLPGDVSTAGGQVWYGGGKLAPDLTLPKLRTRWGPAAPGDPEPDSRIRVTEVYARAADASRQAAEEIRAGRRGAADTARAAADLLTVAAEVTGNPEMRKAADGMSRAARAQWRRIPAASDSGRMLRAAARA
ncbi:MAG: relaxase/mobilization nuclease domain-containing protein, partial [Trebonia sp.]